MAIHSPTLHEDWQARIWRSPDLYLHKIDVAAARGLVVAVGPDYYRRASFLDDRALAPTAATQWVPLDALLGTQKRAEHEKPLHFIFHTGHVGSTLVSRLLEECAPVLSLREPLPMHTLADLRDRAKTALVPSEQYAQTLDLLHRLWRRGYAQTGAVVLKAPSATGRIATDLLLAIDGARATYLNVTAHVYVTTMLAGDASLADLRGYAQSRHKRLQARLGEPLAPEHQMTIGETAALAWLAETLSMHEALELCATRLVALDFDDFLADVGASMARIVRHLRVPVDTSALSAIAESATLKRYSKALEYEYSPRLRAQVLQDSWQRNHGEIKRGVAWLERLAATNNVVAKAYGRPR
jgi:hypothetical protein